MEVLISIFVLSIGVMGLAALIPIGRLSLMQAAKADRSAACGRDALRDFKIRRMLDYQYWNPGVAATTTNGLTPFAIDPLGLAHSMGNTLGPINRIGLSYLANQAAAEQVFLSQDDLVADPPIDAGTRTQAQYTQTDGTVGPNAPTGATPVVNGHYSWFATVVPSAGEAGLALGSAVVGGPCKTTFTVSIVVCYRRNFTPAGAATDAGETVTTAKFLAAAGSVAPSGGSVKLTAAVNVRENDWVMLAGSGQCKWYRVVAAGELPTQMLTLAGPDWANPTQDATAVIVDSVVGVYTTTIELDRDPLWSR